MNNKIKDAFRNNTYTVILFGLLIAVLALFSALKGAAFWQVNLWKGMTMQFPEYACVALGLMFVFVSGHLDMSQVLLGNFASIMAVNYMASHVVEGMTDGQVGGVIGVAIAMALGIAVVGAIINFVLVSYLNVPPVMATIAMQMVWKGLSTALTKGYAVQGVPSLYTTIGHTYIGGFLAVPVVIFLVLLVIVTSFVLNKTMFGRALYAIGGNEVSAERAGYNVKRTKFILYTVVGAVSGFIGMIRVCMESQSIPKAMIGKEMTIIPAVILGGASIYGGEGTVFGTMVAVGIISLVSNSMLILGIGSYWQQFFNGLVILVGVTVSALQARRKH